MDQPVQTTHVRSLDHSHYPNDETQRWPLRTNEIVDEETRAEVIDHGIRAEVLVLHLGAPITIIVVVVDRYPGFAIVSPEAAIVLVETNTVLPVLSPIHLREAVGLICGISILSVEHGMD